MLSHTIVKPAPGVSSALIFDCDISDLTWFVVIIWNTTNKSLKNCTTITTNNYTTQDADMIQESNKS